MLLFFAFVLPFAICQPQPNLLEEFQKGQTFFAAALYKEVAKVTPGNFLLSPFSAQTILALTEAGAKGATSEELRAGLHLPKDSSAFYKQLLPTFNQNDSEYELSTANRIYVKDGLKLSKGFENLAVDAFQAGVENVDFKQAFQAAATINRFVEGQTHDKIKNLISPDALSASTTAVLVNALYFKGNFSEPFKSHSTAKAAFYRKADDKVMVETMRQTSTFNFYESKELDAKFLEMPYEGNDVSLVIVLPNGVSGLAALESRIEEVLVAPPFERRKVYIQLPKFVVESEFNLKPILKNLGIRKVFSDEADLSGIVDGENDLKVDGVVQKTFINVTETGTEAAAATYVEIVDRIDIVDVDPTNAIDLNVDHPFMFYLSFKHEVVLMIGKINF